VREPVIICDCCGASTKTFSIVEVTAGPLRSTLPSPLDLCPGCCDRFLDMIRGRRQTHHDGAGTHDRGPNVQSIHPAPANAS
jgi:hypothetical protein